MSAADRRTALAALQQARPAIARLEVDRHPEDVAADLIEGWSAVETALRSLLGGSALSGQPLVHELRNRQLISIDQAHSLVRFLDARTRASRTDYRPTQADCDAAREAFGALEGSLAGPDGGGARTASAAYAPAPDPLAATVAPAAPIATARRRSPWIAAVAGLVLLAVVGVAAWLALRPTTYETAMRNGRALFQAGSLNAAVGEFHRAARAEPGRAAPHVYLGRIAREQGDFATAAQELGAAIRADTANADALREMGSLQLLRGDNVLARNFYVRAVRANPADRTAQGYLACALARLGQLQQAQSFHQRAGDGPWAACVVPILQQSMSQQPGAAIPR
jgi:cytochrome c-type biogenesis protein CcmH/NrfG